MPERQRINLRVVQAASLLYVFIPITDDDGEVLDLTGYSARMQIRDSAGGDFLLDELTSAVDDGIVLGLGSITLERGPGATTDYPVGAYVYDLQVTDANDVVQVWFEGAFTVVQGVTEPAA